MRVGFLLHRHHIYWSLVLLLVLSLTVILPAGCESEVPPAEEMTLTLSSTAFQDGGSIPEKYTCGGEDISPQLSWSEPPADTRSLVLIVDDIDTGSKFTHWVIFNIPSSSRELTAAIPVQPQLSGGALQGKNDFGTTGYYAGCYRG